MSSRRRRRSRRLVRRPASNLAGEYGRLRDTLGPDHPDTRAAFEERAHELLADEAADPDRGLWWVSFTSQGENVGSCIVVADGPAGAIRATNALKINPGGAARVAGPMSLDGVPVAWRLEWCLRLLTPDEVDGMPGPHGEAPGR